MHLGFDAFKKVKCFANTTNEKEREKKKQTKKSMNKSIKRIFYTQPVYPQCANVWFGIGNE